MTGSPSSPAPSSTPSSYARLAGLAYLAIIVTGIYGEFVVRSGLVVPGDPASTARNIAGAEMLFRSGLAAELVMLTADVFLALALYVVFRAVSRELALLAAFFRLTHAAVVGANLLLIQGALTLSGAPAWLEGLGSGPREALTLLLLETHGYGYALGLVFFGVHCLVLGTLVLRSAGVPRALGILLLVAGAGYLVDTFARTLLPTYAAWEGVFTAVVFGPAFVGELAFALWLVGRGVAPDGPRNPAPA